MERRRKMSGTPAKLCELSTAELSAMQTHLEENNIGQQMDCESDDDGMNDDGPDPKRGCVLCCQCGVQMQPNPSNTCLYCLKATVDITEEVPDQVVLPHCRECNRYLGDSGRWFNCDLESRELLGLCLKRIKNLRKLKLIDAKWIWTEEHSKRLKLKLTLQKEIHHGAILQQETIVEFFVNNHQCDDCKRSYTPHTWKACVQVRQRGCDHRRSLYYLEQLILKHEAHDKLLFLSQAEEGLDFHFLSKSHANAFKHFVRDFLCSKHKESRELVSHDGKSNVFNYKYSIVLDIAPICRDDLVFLPKKITAANGGLPQLSLVQKVTTSISLLDNATLNGCDVANVKFWEEPFKAVLSRKHLTEFVVLDYEDQDTVGDHQRSQLGDSLVEQESVNKKRFGPRRKLKLCEVEILRVSDLGVNNNEPIRVRCHLGGQIDVGDHVLGYDLRHVNVSGIDDEEFEKYMNSSRDRLQEVILVKRKLRMTAEKRQAKRKWELKRLPVEREEGNSKWKEGKDDERDYEGFMEELDEDAELRKEVNLHKKNESDNPFLKRMERKEKEREARVKNKFDILEGVPEDNFSYASSDSCSSNNEWTEESPAKKDSKPVYAANKRLDAGEFGGGGVAPFASFVPGNSGLASAAGRFGGLGVGLDALGQDGDEEDELPLVDFGDLLEPIKQGEEIVKVGEKLPALKEEEDAGGISSDVDDL